MAESDRRRAERNVDGLLAIVKEIVAETAAKKGSAKPKKAAKKKPAKAKIKPKKAAAKKPVKVKTKKAAKATTKKTSKKTPNKKAPAPATKSAEEWLKLHINHAKPEAEKSVDEAKKHGMTYAAMAEMWAKDIKKDAPKSPSRASIIAWLSEFAGKHGWMPRPPNGPRKPKGKTGIKKTDNAKPEGKTGIKKTDSAKPEGGKAKPEGGKAKPEGGKHDHAKAKPEGGKHDHAKAIKDSIDDRQKFPVAHQALKDDKSVTKDDLRSITKGITGVEPKKKASKPEMHRAIAEAHQSNAYLHEKEKRNSGITPW